MAWSGRVTGQGGCGQGCAGCGDDYLQVEGSAAAGKTAIRGNLGTVFSLATDHILGDSHYDSDWVLGARVRCPFRECALLLLLLVVSLLLLLLCCCTRCSGGAENCSNSRCTKIACQRQIYEAPTHTHTHTHCVLLGASASVSPCFVGTLFMITELVPIDWWGAWVARVGKSFSPGRASWHANEPYEIINNGLIKRQLTKCVINWFCVQFVWSQISDRHCQMHTKGGGTKARRVVGPALG